MATEREKVKVWRSRLERAKKRRKKNKEEWDENLEFYINGHGSRSLVGEHDHEIIINKVFSTLRSQLPGLIFSRPKWDVRAKRRILVQGQDGAAENVAPEFARAKEKILNHYWTELNVQFQVRLAVLSSFIAMGVVKVGYTPDFEDNPNAGEFALDDEGNLTVGPGGHPKLAKGDYLRDDNGEPIIDPDTGLPLLEPGELLTNEDFFVKWVDWNNMLFDPEGTNDFATHAWVAEEWVRPTAEVRKDKLFKHRSQIQPTETVIPADKTGNMLEALGGAAGATDENVRDDEERTRGCTIYNLKKRRVMVLLDSGLKGGNDFFIRDDALPDEQERGPYVFLKPNEVPGRWEPLPDITPLRSPQEEINILRSKVLTHIARGDRKYGYDEGAFEDEDSIQKLIGGGDMTLVAINGNRDSVWPIPMAPMDPAIHAAIPDMDRSFDEVAGQPAEARGIARAETATQASILENRNVIRESDRRDNLVHDFVRDIGRKLLQTLKANLTKPVWISLGDTNDPFPFEADGRLVTRDELQDEADVSIQVGSMLPKTNSVMRQQFSALMATLAQAPFLAGSEKLLDRVFEMFEVENTGLAKEVAALARQSLQGEGGQASGQVGDLPNETAGISSPVGGVPTPVVNTRQ
tara:strand:+ start:3089 stop:4993 length:1905 start_codon:yes stop_codon:yes gene_type:complete